MKTTNNVEYKVRHEGLVREGVFSDSKRKPIMEFTNPILKKYPGGKLVALFALPAVQQ